MNPIHWVRWKVVAVLAVLGGLVYFLGLDKVALSRINAEGRENRAARWSITDFALGILAGDARLADLNVATPRAKAEDRVLGASAAQMDVSMLDLLRRQYVVEKAELDGPKLAVKRKEDGSINIEDFGEKPETPESAPKKPEDWYETVKRWYERIDKWQKRLPDRRKPKPPREPGFQVDTTRGVDYPFESRPSYAVEELTSKNLEISFEDEGSGQKLPGLEQGTITLRNLTSSPTVQSEPSTIELSGVVAGSKLSVKGSLDLRGGGVRFDLNGDTGDLPVSLVEAFVGPSLPVKLKSGTVRVALQKLLVNGNDSLDVAPLLIFRGLQIEPKDSSGKIAKIDAAAFARTFNEASSQLEELRIEDLRITGSLPSPKFEWGDTFTRMMTSGASAFAAKQADKAIEKGKEALEKRLEKSGVLEKLPSGTKDALKGVKTDDLQKGLEGGLKGIFGGSKKETEPAPTPGSEAKEKK